MTDERETPGGEPPRRSEGDLLAERRARRAAESGEGALTRRAEAAEATVQTLERHVASLQARLRESDEERRGTAELVEAEQALAREREHELRRVKQREYAEQQLRVEAEDRLIILDRESRAEIEGLTTRLGSSERDARLLAERLERVQRQVAESEQAAAAERAAVRRSEHELQERLGELERRAAEIQLGLEAERAARERSERQLHSIREGHRKIEAIISDMKAIVARLLVACSRAASRPEYRLTPVAEPGSSASPARGAPGARAPEAIPPEPPARPRASPEPPAPPLLSPEPPADAPSGQTGERRGEEMADALAGAVERLRRRAEASAIASAQAAPAPSRPVAHKHSMSLIQRWRIRRKQRRGR